VNRAPSREDDRLLRYVLGESSDAERQEIEEGYFANPERMDELLAVEDALVERYVRGELSAEQRARFAAHVLVSEEGREKVRLARSLIRVAERERAPGPPRRWITAPMPRFRQLAWAAGLLGAFAALWFVGRWGSQPQRLAQNAVPAGANATPSPSRAAAGAPAARVAFLALVPGAARSGTALPSLELTPDVGSITLRAYLDAGHVVKERYRAAFETPDRRVVLRRAGLNASSSDTGSFVDIELARGDLAPGELILIVWGASAAGPYSEVADYRLRLTVPQPH
jgi:hypothetical protein